MGFDPAESDAVFQEETFEPEEIIPEKTVEYAAREELLGDLILMEIPLANLEVNHQNSGEQSVQQGEDEFGDFNDFPAQETRSSQLTLPENRSDQEADFVQGETEELTTNLRVEGEFEGQTSFRDSTPQIVQSFGMFTGETLDDLSQPKIDHEKSQGLEAPEDEEFGNFEDPEIELKTAEQAKLSLLDQDLFQVPSGFEDEHTLVAENPPSNVNLFDLGDIVIGESQSVELLETASKIDDIPLNTDFESKIDSEPIFDEL